jgi:hypothetical protein
MEKMDFDDYFETKGHKHKQHERKESLFKEEAEDIKEIRHGTHKEFGGVFG